MFVEFSRFHFKIL